MWVEIATRLIVKKYKNPHLVSWRVRGENEGRCMEEDESEVSAAEAGGGSDKVAPFKEPKEDGKEGGLQGTDPILLLTRAVLTLPTLMHYAVQSIVGQPTSPLGQGGMSGKDWMTIEEKEMGPKHEDISKKLSGVAAKMFLFFWSIIAIAWIALVAQSGGC